MTYDIGGQTVAAISGCATRASVGSGFDSNITLPSGIRPSAKQTIVGYTIDDRGSATDPSSGFPEVVTIDTGSIKLSDVFDGSNAKIVQFEGVYLVD